MSAEITAAWSGIFLPLPIENYSKLLEEASTPLSLTKEFNVVTLSEVEGSNLMEGFQK